MRDTLLVFACLIFGLTSVVTKGEQLNGADDFNDNVRDVAKWGSNDNNLFNGVLTETSGRLEYSIDTSPSIVDFAQRTWQLNKASYTNDWIAQTEVNVPELALASNGDAVQMGLGLVVDGTAGDNLAINVVCKREGGQILLTYETAIQRAGIDVPGLAVEQARTAILTKVRLRFTAADKVIHLEFEQDGNPGQWQELASYDLDSTEVDWHLADEATFDVSLIGTSFYTFVTSASEVWFDNFLAASKPVILEQPKTAFVLDCEAATFDVTADAGPNVTYQWRHQGTNLIGEVSPELIVSEFVANREGDYDVVVGNSAGTTISTTAFLGTVVADFYLIGINPQNDSVHVKWGKDCNSASFILQKRNSLSDGNWEDVAPPYPVNGSYYDVPFPVSGESMFFRLNGRF